MIIICNFIAVDRIEACGLCFPEQRDAKQKNKHKVKDGAYRDNTVWLDANHSFQYYLDKQHIQAYVCEGVVFRCFGFVHLFICSFFFVSPLSFAVDLFSL
jgi:hypothetical protein